MHFNKFIKFFSSAVKNSQKTRSRNHEPHLATAKKLPRVSSTSKPPSDLQKPPKSTATISPPVSTEVLSRLKKAALNNSQNSLRNDEDSAIEVSKVISSILFGNIDKSSTLSSSESKDEVVMKNILDIPWFSSMDNLSSTKWRREISRERKQKFIFKHSESRRFEKLMQLCANKLGTESTIDFFGKMGRETSVREYNALIKLCIDKARYSSDEEDSVGHIYEAYRLFKSMIEKGFLIEEETYGTFLMLLVNCKLTEEFEFFSNFFKQANPKSSSRIAYYEMLHWIRVDNENKIGALCRAVEGASNEDINSLRESYLLAFCVSDRKEELLQLFESVDIKSISSAEYVSTVFKSLGRLQLENFTERFISELKTAGTGSGEQQMSIFIHDYATSLPNLSVEETVAHFGNLHKKLGVVPSYKSCDKLISQCCNLSKVALALDIVDYMCQNELNIKAESFDPILHACEQYYQFEMVHTVYKMMKLYKLKPKGETFRSMISMYVKMKDFEGAYNLLADMEEMKETATTSMYNAVLLGYFREKNTRGAMMVLKQMEDADVKPDSETYSYLITNCDTENDISKLRDQMSSSGVQVTKYVYMALITAYANFGNFELAKQVCLDCRMPANCLNEIKSVLVSALASNAQIFDALGVYDEIKKARCNLEPKAVICLIDHLQTEGQIDRLLQLLDELKDTSNWFDGCSRVITYCIRFNVPSTAVELLKQLKEKEILSTHMVLDQIFSQVWEEKPPKLKIGLEILQAVKEELKLHPSRTSLDFLLSTCVKAKDSRCAHLVWSEYKRAGLSYNVLTFLRMYQALMASGERQEASKLMATIPKEDPHVRAILKACKGAYSSS